MELLEEIEKHTKDYADENIETYDENEALNKIKRFKIIVKNKTNFITRLNDKLKFMTKEL